MNVTTLPNTVRELAEMAEARGIRASELLAELWPDADKMLTKAVQA